MVGLALLDSPVGDADGASAHSWKLLALMMKRRWCGQAGLPALMKKTLPTQVLESNRVDVAFSGCTFTACDRFHPVNTCARRESTEVEYLQRVAHS